MFDAKSQAMSTWGSVSHMVSAVIIQFCLCSSGAAMEQDLMNNRQRAMSANSALSLTFLEVLRKAPRSPSGETCQEQPHTYTSFFPLLLGSLVTEAMGTQTRVSQLLLRTPKVRLGGTW